MPDGRDKRNELAAFLRTRRERIPPESVGLPAGSRRRTNGLRREEVAVLAGVSPTWYTYLEQGRNIRPSTEVLDSLARVLGLSEDERRYMHMLAHGQAPPANRSQDPQPGQFISEVVTALSSDDCPIYHANQNGDVLAWNAAAVSWYGDFAAMPPERRNIMWWTFTEPTARDRLVEWEDEARDYVARFRGVWAQRPQDKTLHAIIADLREASPDFNRWWNGHDVVGQRTRTRLLRHPVHGIREWHLVVLYMADNSFDAIIVHVPANEVHGAPPPASGPSRPLWSTGDIVT
ncbi:helix-turn-helix transcriptional regulator [Kutzneria sp. NPDC051319]|uniref:helix-turn-helix transcriptional regulator n=1 Tax=Kutzneria sp. NPDC051319 TaxID=3155047 RepID=UPI00344ACD9E